MQKMPWAAISSHNRRLSLHFTAIRKPPLSWWRRGSLLRQANGAPFQ